MPSHASNPLKTSDFAFLRWQSQGITHQTYQSTMSFNDVPDVLLDDFSGDDGRFALAPDAFVC